MKCPAATREVSSSTYKMETQFMMILIIVLIIFFVNNIDYMLIIFLYFYLVLQRLNLAKPRNRRIILNSSGVVLLSLEIAG
jgi:hypothetical protein